MHEIIQNVVNEISAACAREPLLNRDVSHRVPQRDKIITIIKELRKVIFPGYFCEEHNDFFFGYTLNNVWNLLMEQLKIAFLLQCENGAHRRYARRFFGAFRTSSRCF